MAGNWRQAHPGRPLTKGFGAARPGLLLQDLHPNCLAPMRERAHERERGMGGAQLQLHGAFGSRRSEEVVKKCACRWPFSVSHIIIIIIREKVKSYIYMVTHIHTHTYIYIHT